MFEILMIAFLPVFIDFAYRNFKGIFDSRGFFFGKYMQKKNNKKNIL